MKQWEADIGDLQNGEWPADAQKRRHREKLAADAAAASLQVDADHHCHQPLRSGRTPKPQERADREAAKPPQQVAEEQRRANLTAEQRIAENRERKRERDRVQKAKKHHPERFA